AVEHLRLLEPGGEHVDERVDRGRHPGQVAARHHATTGGAPPSSSSARFGSANAAPIGAVSPANPGPAMFGTRCVCHRCATMIVAASRTFAGTTRMPATYVALSDPWNARPLTVSSIPVLESTSSEAGSHDSSPSSVSIDVTVS